MRLMFWRAQAQGHRHCWQPVAAREADNGCKLLPVTQCSITVPAGSDYGAALGAARLGQAAAGNLGAGELPAIMQKPDMAEQIDPDKTLTDAYEGPIMRWRDLYHAAKC